MAPSMEDHYCSSKSSNKITEIVRLQQIIKKWKKLAKSSTTTTTTKKTSVGGFLKRTLSFTDTTSATIAPTSCGDVPKGYLAVCVGEELRRYVMPTEYLSQGAFVALLREAEEEFGFQQEGVLRIPCDVLVFEGLMRKAVEDDQKRRSKVKDGGIGLSHYCSAEADQNNMIFFR